MERSERRRRVTDPENERILTALANTPERECLTCGHPQLRPAGHADWCAPHNEREAARSRRPKAHALDQGDLDDLDYADAVRSPSLASLPALVIPGAGNDGGDGPHDFTTEVGPSNKTPAVSAAGVQNTAV